MLSRACPLVVFACFALGCRSTQTQVGGTESPDDRAGKPAAGQPTSSAENEVRKPFMFDEAKLPRGFPPPGPIGEVIVKQYPAYRLARVRAVEVGGSDGSMFNPLFRHIQRNDIKMTAPVEMEYPEAEAVLTADGPSRPPRPQTMAFLYQAPELGAPGPDPDDPRVQVVDMPPVTVLSVTYRGGYSGDNLAAGLRRIAGWLAEHPGRAEVLGPPRMIGYNSPFVPAFLRIGEVQVPVRMQNAE